MSGTFPPPPPIIAPPLRASSFSKHLPLASYTRKPKKRSEVSLLIQFAVGGVLGLVLASTILGLIRQERAKQQPIPVASVEKAPTPRPTMRAIPAPPRDKMMAKSSSRPRTVSPPKPEVPEQEPEEMPDPPKKRMGFSRADPAKDKPQTKPTTTPKPSNLEIVQVLLKSPEVDSRLNAARELRQKKPSSEELSLLIPSLLDISQEIQKEVLAILSEAGQGASGLIGDILEYHQKTDVPEMKILSAVTLLRIAPSSDEAKQAFSPLLVGGKGRKPQPVEGPLVQVRITACKELSLHGSSAQWAEPMLLEILNLAGKSLEENEGLQTFSVAADAISKLTSQQPTTIKRLEAFRSGKGLSARGKPTVERAKQAADTALRRMKGQSTTPVGRQSTALISRPVT